MQHQRGFTLIELIMVIVIMGVIGGMVSVFMKSPIDAYFDLSLIHISEPTRPY